MWFDGEEGSCLFGRRHGRRHRLGDTWYRPTAAPTRTFDVGSAFEAYPLILTDSAHFILGNLYCNVEDN